MMDLVVNHQDERQIITVCFKLGCKTKLSDHKRDVTLHREICVVFPL